MERNSSKTENPKTADYGGAGLAIGAAIGMILGLILFENLVMGFAYRRCNRSGNGRYSRCT